MSRGVYPFLLPYKVYLLYFYWLLVYFSTLCSTQRDFTLSCGNTLRWRVGDLTNISSSDCYSSPSSLTVLTLWVGKDHSYILTYICDFLIVETIHNLYEWYTGMLKWKSINGFLLISFFDTSPLLTNVRW